MAILIGKKVVIIGSPGAGKSYLSRELAEKTGLPVVHLDYYFHQQGPDYLNDEVAWRKLVRELVKGDTWIIEGNYKRTTFDIRLPEADTIIHLEYPSYITVTRAIKRRVQYHGKRRPEMPETWKEKLDPEFFRYIINYRRKDLPRVREEIKKYPGRQVITLKNPRQTKKFLRSL